jgi:DNA end-binding protein Ku
MEKKANVPRRPIWTGSLTIGLVYDRGISFRFLHKTDGQPLKYQKVCTKDQKVIPWQEVAKGYEVTKNEYVIFDKEELEAVKPESDRRIRLDKFVDYFSVDPIYFDRSYALMPDKSNDAYGLLLTALEKKGKAGVGRITLRTKEYPALVHTYKGALVLTTLRYAYDVVDPQGFEELKKLKEPEKAELDLAVKIVTDLSGEFDVTEYKDNYKQKVEELIKKKLKGETVVVEKPVEEEAKELMVALRDTLKQLEKK